MEDEIWKDIPGYEGLYVVSSFGRIKSINYHNTGCSRIMRQTKRNGYLSVGLFKGGKQKMFLAHRLVALVFIPNPHNLPQVNHKDEDKTNNCVENLEWCDASYNRNFGTCNQRAAKTKSKSILQYDLEGNLVREWSSISEINRELGYHTSHISACARGMLNTMYGYKWKYTKKRSEE